MRTLLVKQAEQHKLSFGAFNAASSGLDFLCSIPTPLVWGLLAQHCSSARLGPGDRAMWYQPGGHFLLVAATKAGALAMMRTLPDGHLAEASGSDAAP